MKKPPLYLQVKNDIFLLYLKGIRGIFEKKSKFISYNFYPRIVVTCGTFYFYFWFRNQKK